jgi:putative flavoprotein involved in K+ transport
MDTTNTVVVGAGQAGLAISYLLKEAGVDHVVFERGRLGESWRSQRWDSFHLNTPNWANLLPGPKLDDCDEHAFAHKDQLIDFLERYASSFDAPVRQETTVTRVTRQDDGIFEVDTTAGSVKANNVVVCSGSMSDPNVPSMAANIDESILTLSAGTYRNAASLPEGAAVVVGSGQSGCQIVEDLLDAGRKVYLCASRVARVPRSYRGRDILAWMRDLKLFEVRLEDLEDPNEAYATQPQVSGTRGGHTISLQSLARDGATLLGRVESVNGKTLSLRPDLLDSAEFADERCALIKNAIDQAIAAHDIDAPAAEPDPYEPPMPDLGGSEMIETLDLGEAGVGTIIWCTGFRGNFSWIEHDIFDARGMPRHSRGVSDVEGLYFVGFPWLSKRKSGILYGVAEDAGHVVNTIIKA